MIKWMILAFLAIPIFADLTPESEYLDLLGRDTPHWSYVTEKDHEIIDPFEAVYRIHKPLIDKPSEQLKIPKTIHCIWLGPRPFPQSSVENMRSWVALHPGWTFKFWTDSKRLPPCEEFEVCSIEKIPFKRLRRYYDLSANWGERSDYLRYEILFDEGGLYIDHDAKAYQAFDAFHTTYDLYTGTEAPHKPVDGYAITAGNSLIGSAPGHPVLAGCFDQVDQDWLTDMHQEAGLNMVLSRSYMALTYSLLNHMNEAGHRDIVFPSTFFHSSEYLPAFYSRHYSAQEWCGKDPHKFILKRFDSLRRKSRKIEAYLLYCLGLQAIVAAAVLVRRRRVS